MLFSYFNTRSLSTIFIENYSLYGLNDTKFDGLSNNFNLLQKHDIFTDEETNLTQLNTTTDEYNFHDPVIAYLLLQKLDIFGYEGTNLTQTNASEWYFYGTDINDNYCEDHRAYFVNHTNSIFNEKKFFNDNNPFHRLKRNTIPKIGQDMHPNISLLMPKEKMLSFDEKLNHEINIFYTFEPMFQYRVVGKQFSCLTQISNHCPGRESLYRKDKAGQALIKYAEQYKTRPQCFNTDKFFPETWMLSSPKQCEKFFNVFNSPEYFKLKAERNIVFIRKIGNDVHQGQGVFPVNDEEEKYIRELYGNGSKCKEVQENNLMQTFIHNPLLLQNRKFHFRVFMLFASTNPFLVYYHDGYLRISFQEYDTSSTERGTFVTNLGMTSVLFQNRTGNNTTTDISRQDSYWFYPEFHQYLMEQGLITDPNWLDNYLRVEMKKAMVHLTRMAQDTYWRNSSLMELYGVDFMMDDKLNLWFIEANARPLNQGWDVTTTQFFDKLLSDTFEIAFGLLKSRTKRIINYINKLIKEKDTWTFENENINLKDLEEKREEFHLLTMNRFEPEFKPSKEIGFYQIIDENLEGVNRYFNLLEEECL